MIIQLADGQRSPLVQEHVPQGQMILSQQRIGAFGFNFLPLPHGQGALRKRCILTGRPFNCPEDERVHAW
jgi:hypothetical protein